MLKHARAGSIIALLFLASALPLPAFAASDDNYLRGYIEALLRFELNLEDVAVKVTDGAVTLDGINDKDEGQRVRQRLAGVKGVAYVSVVGENGGTPKKITRRRLLFTPAIADPRSPRFSAAWHNDIVRDENSGPWMIGDNAVDLNFQGAVFSIFDLDGISKDLVNTDFWAALAASWRRPTTIGDFSAMTRVFHQSSHLGDEYILFNKVTERDRVNLSYEGVDLTVAWQPEMDFGLRIYGGGGYLFGRDPASLDPWSAKIGMEIESPDKVWGAWPVAAIHVQTFEDTGFEPDLSLMAGLQFNNPVREDRQIRLLLSYFNGYSPNGQFYDEQLEYVGLGLQYQF